MNTLIVLKTLSCRLLAGAMLEEVAGLFRSLEILGRNVGELRAIVGNDVLFAVGRGCGHS